MPPCGIRARPPRRDRRSRPCCRPAVLPRAEGGAETGAEARVPARAAGHRRWARGASEPETAFEPRFDRAPVRFVWRIDSDGKFRSLSPEFSAAVGPNAADILERSFAEVASAYGMDPAGEVAGLLERRDTWSGRTVHWPVEHSGRRVPVDLAALPVYARDRSFDGFRGFGIVRLAESTEAPGVAGMLLGSEAFERAERQPETRPVAEQDAAVGEAGAEASEPGDEHPAAFGRRAPEDRPAPPEDAAATSKVIRLEERRRSKDGHLSQAEEAAFRAIGETLGEGEPAGRLERAIQSAAWRIGEFEVAGDAEGEAHRHRSRGQRHHGGDGAAGRRRGGWRGARRERRLARAGRARRGGLGLRRPAGCAAAGERPR